MASSVPAARRRLLFLPTLLLSPSIAGGFGGGGICGCFIFGGASFSSTLGFCNRSRDFYVPKPVTNV